MMRRAFVAALVLGLFLNGAVAAAPGNAAYVTPAMLRAFVRTALPTAPTYFRSLRGGVSRTTGAYIYFALSPSFAKVCPTCMVADEFATADSNERFATEADWPIPATWTIAQAGVFLQKNITPLMVGTPAKHGKDSDGNAWVDWFNAKTRTFVYAQTYQASGGGNHVDVRIGHYVPVNAHYVKWARLTPDERTDLSSGIEQLVTAATSASSGNFVSLRGVQSDPKYADYKPTQTFGTVLTGCEIDGTFADETGAGVSGKWIMGCDTPDIGDKQADMLELIRSAVAAALPAGFTVTTDPKYAGDDDFRWDRSSDMTSIDITHYANDDGTVEYHIQIYHYTS
jgi:hypothetical protein